MSLLSGETGLDVAQQVVIESTRAMPQPPPTTRTDSHPDLMGSLIHTDEMPTACRVQMPQPEGGLMLGLLLFFSTGGKCQLSLVKTLVPSGASFCLREKGSGLGSSQLCQDAF